MKVVEGTTKYDVTTDLRGALPRCNFVCTEFLSAVCVDVQEIQVKILSNKERKQLQHEETRPRMRAEERAEPRTRGRGQTRQRVDLNQSLK